MTFPSICLRVLWMQSLSLSLCNRRQSRYLRASLNGSAADTTSFPRTDIFELQIFSYVVDRPSSSPFILFYKNSLLLSPLFALSDICLVYFSDAMHFCPDLPVRSIRKEQRRTCPRNAEVATAFARDSLVGPLKYTTMCAYYNSICSAKKVNDFAEVKKPFHGLGTLRSVRYLLNH